MAALLKNRRGVFRLVLFALGVLAVFAAVSFVPAALDEDRDAATLQWLVTEPPSIDPANNAHVAMLALNASESVTPAQIAAFHLLQRTIHASGESDPHYWSDDLYMRARTENLPAMRIPDALDGLDDCLTDCPAYILREHDVVARAAESTVLLRERYRAMLLQSEYQDDSPRDPRVVTPDYKLASKLGVIHLAEIMADVKAGKVVAAYERWANYQRFWQRVLEGSASLDGHLLARRQLEKGLQVIAYLLESSPATAPVAAEKFGLVHDSKKLPVAEALRLAMIGEFQRRAYVLTDLVFHQPVFRMRTAGEENSSTWLDRLYLVLYQPNASLNLMRREMDKGLYSVTRSLDVPSGEVPNCAHKAGLRAALNFVGYRLACTYGAIDTAEWIAAAKVIDERTDILFSRLNISRREQSTQR